MVKKIASIMLASSLVFGMVAPTALADTTGAKYKDGSYTGQASVLPDEDQDFDAYDIKVDVTVENGAVSKVDYSADTAIDPNNQAYANWAMNGRRNKPGTAARIIEANGIEGVDTFSGATCTSKGILEAAGKALEQAVNTEPVTEPPIEPATEPHTKPATEPVTESPTESATEPVPAETPVSGYVLMNIPYAKFYGAEKAANADAVSKATTKALNSGLAAGSYHAGYAAPDPASNAQMLGVTYPVYVNDMKLVSTKGSPIPNCVNKYFTPEKAAVKAEGILIRNNNCMAILSSFFKSTFFSFSMTVFTCVPPQEPRRPR